MNILEQCLERFERLMPVKYYFQISRKKVITNIIIDFEESDFKHLIGLQYLKDISISRNSVKAYKDIKDNKLTYEVLSGSHFFEEVKDSYACVKDRMTYFPHIEKFLESENVILRYAKEKNPYSKIKADYFIESTVDNKTAYIFFRQRKRDEDVYGIVSFFLKDKVIYRGEQRYWLLKQKIVNGETQILYMKENYSKIVSDLFIETNR